MPSRKANCLASLNPALLFSLADEEVFMQKRRRMLKTIYITTTWRHWRSVPCAGRLIGPDSCNKAVAFAVGGLVRSGWQEQAT